MQEIRLQASIWLSKQTHSSNRNSMSSSGKRSICYTNKKKRAHILASRKCAINKMREKHKLLDYIDWNKDKKNKEQMFWNHFLASNLLSNLFDSHKQINFILKCKFTHGSLFVTDDIANFDA